MVLDQQREQLEDLGLQAAGVASSPQLTAGHVQLIGSELVDHRGIVIYAEAVS